MKKRTLLVFVLLLFLSATVFAGEEGGFDPVAQGAFPASQTIQASGKITQSSGIYYVDSTITDTNVASAVPDFLTYNPDTFSTTTGSSPVYKTIADVNLKTFLPGDNIYFRKGQTWTEALTIPSSGSAGNPITFGAYGSGEKPIIDATGLAYGIYGLEKNYITITGMEVKNADDFGIRNRAGSNWLITLNTVHTMGAPNDDYPCDGIAIESGTNADASNNTISYNTVYEIGRHGIHLAAFITTDCQDNIIEHNTVYNCYHSMIGMQNAGNGGGGSLLHGNIIRYNTVYVNGDYADFAVATCGIYQSGSLGTGYVSDGTEIYYNVIYDIPGRGIDVNYYTTNSLIYNNILVRQHASYATPASGIAVATVANGTTGITIKNNIVTGFNDGQLWVQDIDSMTAVDYNLWYGIGAEQYAIVEATHYHSDDFDANANYKGTTGFDAHGLWEDPLFTDAAGGDFTLLSNSPAIDAGVDVGLTEDYAGNTVPFSDAPEIGAYETSVYLNSLTFQNIAAVGPNVPPAFSSATIATNGLDWSIIFTEPVEFGVGGNEGWTVATSSRGVVTLTYSSGSGSNTLVYTGDKRVSKGETITTGLNYTQPGNGIQDPNGLPFATGGPWAVANNSEVLSVQFSAKGYSSGSSYGSTLVGLGTFEAGSGMALGTHARSVGATTMEAGAEIGNGSLAKIFSSLSYLGESGASGESQFTGPFALSLDAAGAFTSESQGDFPLSASMDVDVAIEAMRDATNESAAMESVAAFSTEAQSTSSPASEFSVSADISEDVWTGKYEGISMDAGAGMGQTAPGTNIFEGSVALEVGGATDPSSLAIFYSSLTYLAGDYFQGPQNPTFYDLLTFSGASSFDMTTTGINSVTPGTPFSTVARTTQSSQEETSGSSTDSVEVAFAAQSQEKTSRSVTAEAGSAIVAESTITGPGDFVTFAAGAGAEADHYYLREETVAFEVGADEMQTNQSIQSDAVALSVEAAGTQYGEFPYRTPPFSVSAGFDATVSGGLHFEDSIAFDMTAGLDTSVYGSVPGVEVTPSSSASLQAEAQYTIPDQRRVESAYASAGASATKNATSDSVAMASSAAMTSAGVISFRTYNETVAMAVSGLSSPINQITATRTVALNVVVHQNSLTGKPANAIFYGIQ